MYLLKEYTYDKIVIGGNLSAFIYAYNEKLPLIINKLDPPHRFEKINTNNLKLDLWNKLYFILSLSGLNLLEPTNIRIKKDKIIAITENSAAIKFNINQAIIFDDESVIGLPLAIEKNDKFIVLDWMDAKPCMKHTIDHLSTEDDFVKEIFFYPTERVDGNHLDKKDLVAVSHLTHEELTDFNFSSTYARFKTLKIMGESGIKGSKSGFSDKGQIHHTLKLEVQKREIKKKKMDLYPNSDFMIFNYETPEELCPKLKKLPEDCYASKLNKCFNVL